MTISVVCLFDSNSSIIANQSCNIYAHHSTSFCTTQMWPDWFKLNGKNTENYMASIWQWTSHGRVSVHLPNRYSFPYGTMRLVLCSSIRSNWSSWNLPALPDTFCMTKTWIHLKCNDHSSRNNPWPCIANWIQLAHESYCIRTKCPNLATSWYILVCH